MKDKISLVLKILGCICVFGAVGYDLLGKNPQSVVYWVGLVLGIVLILAGRFIGSISDGSDDDD